MLIAQISDSHLCTPGALSNGVVDTNTFLRDAVEHLLRLSPAPDAVLFTGDLVESGIREEYAMLRKILAPLESLPLFVIPGNHDDRTLMREYFWGAGNGKSGYLPQEGEFLHYTVDGFPLRLIGLDTQVPGEIGGAICGERLAWLEARLAEAPESPTVVFMHHPPFETGQPMDLHMCANADALGEVIARHPRVERVLCGHVHRFIQTSWADTLAMTCPGTAHQVTLNFQGEDRATFSMEPPGLLLHHWRGQAGLVTHLVSVGDFPGPYPFVSGS